jgi:CHAT domain-containing protein
LLTDILRSRSAFLVLLFLLASDRSAFAGLSPGLGYAVCTDNPETLADLQAADLDIQRTQYQQAIGLYLRWLPEIVGNGWLPTEAGIRLNLAVAYDSLGDPATAAAHLGRALEIFTLLGDEAGAGSALLSLSLVLREQGDLSKAKERLEESLRIWRRLGDLKSTSRALADLAILSGTRGKFQEGREGLKEALSLTRERGDRARFLAALALLDWRAGDYDNGIEHSIQASELGFQEADLETVLGGQSLLAMCLIMRGQFDRAYNHMLNAIDLIELLAVNVSASDLKSRFMDKNLELYRMAVWLSAQIGRTSDSFRHAEQAKARSLLDQFWQFRFGDDAATSDLPGRLRQLQRQRAELIAKIQAESRKPIASQDQSFLVRLKVNLDRLQTEEVAFLSRMRLTTPGYANVLGAYSSGIESVQRYLDDKTVLIEYFVVGPNPFGNEGEVFAWVIHKNRFRFIQLAITEADLTRKASMWRRLVAVRGVDRPIATELYQALFAPLVPYLRHRKLIVVPHGILHQLPFSALWNAKRTQYLIDEYVLTQEPSASVLEVIQGRGPAHNPGVLVLGNPDGSLPHAAREAEVVASLYGVKPRLGRDATESAVSKPGPIGILHLAAHATYDHVHPLFSRIDLAAAGESDGRLEMGEILALNLKGTSLVVLSVCRIQAEEATAGDELPGLPRAFLLAGARSVVASLWSVDDRSTDDLMKRFYTHLRKGLGKAEALRRAQRETRARFPHPYDWAAFVLMGAPN